MSRSGNGDKVDLHDPMMEEYQERKKKWYLDVKNTPCARSALVHGILGGVAVGLLYFARTSVVRRSCDFAVGGFVIASLASWEICRFGRAKQRADVKKTVQVLNTISEQMAEGNGGLPATTTVIADRSPTSESESGL